MITRLRIVLVALASGLLAAGCGGGTECGPGTVEQDGECVPSNPLTCGAGTVEQDGECVSPAEIAPAITSIDPVDDFVGGGATFTITGSGFQAADAGTTVVLFGDAEATFTIDSDTQISGTVPQATGKNVTVTVRNDNGAAVTDFTYVGIYGASGSHGFAGELYLIDPRDGTTLALGLLESDSGSHAVTGMEFDAAGTLYATEANYGSTFADTNLVTIDPDTAAVTVVGPLDDGNAINHCCVPDITFAGTTLIGYSRQQDDALSINTTTGAVTMLADNSVNAYGAGVVTLGDGTVILAGQGAGGTLQILDPETGALTAGPALDGTALVSVGALTRYRGTVYGVLKGAVAHSALVSVDTTTGAITELGAMPGGIDALASDDPDAPASAARVPQPRALSASERAALAAPACAGQPGVAKVTIFGAVRAPLAAASIAGRADSLSLPGKLAGRRGIAASSLLGSVQGVTTVEVISCGGEPLRFPAADLAGLALTPNQRGQIKLVDRDGRTLLRNVVELRAF